MNVSFLQTINNEDTSIATRNQNLNLQIDAIEKERCEKICQETATAASIRSVATNHLKCLKHLKNTHKPFSIRDWVQGDVQDSWLFLSASPRQRTSLIPLLSAWYASVKCDLLFQLVIFKAWGKMKLF